MESKITNLTYTQTKKLIESNPNLKIWMLEAIQNLKRDMYLVL